MHVRTCLHACVLTCLLGTPCSLTLTHIHNHVSSAGILHGACRSLQGLCERICLGLSRVRKASKSTVQCRVYLFLLTCLHPYMRTRLHACGYMFACLYALSCSDTTMSISSGIQLMYRYYTLINTGLSLSCKIYVVDHF